jgi:hypothetical protein
MSANAAWGLEDFVDSLVVELDKTRETLAVKAINKKLTYSVKEVALDVNAFPTYDGDKVRFVTAQPGEEGASKLTIQLGSVTDQQVRASSKQVEGSDASPSLDELDVDPATRTKLRRIGVKSVDDLAALEERKVDLKQATDSDLDYTELARKIRKARRSAEAPTLEGLSLTSSSGQPCLLLEGRNLSVDPTFPPVAVLNGRLAEVLSSGPGHLAVLVDPEHPLRSDNEVVVTFDPFAVVRVNVKA